MKHKLSKSRTCDYKILKCSCNSLSCLSTFKFFLYTKLTISFLFLFSLPLYPETIPDWVSEFKSGRVTAKEGMEGIGIGDYSRDKSKEKKEARDEALLDAFQKLVMKLKVEVKGYSISQFKALRDYKIKEVSGHTGIEQFTKLLYDLTVPATKNHEEYNDRKEKRYLYRIYISKEEIAELRNKNYSLVKQYYETGLSRMEDYSIAVRYFNAAYQLARGFREMDTIAGSDGRLDEIQLASEKKLTEITEQILAQIAPVQITHLNKNYWDNKNIEILADLSEPIEIGFSPISLSPRGRGQGEGESSLSPSGRGKGEGAIVFSFKTGNGLLQNNSMQITREGKLTNYLKKAYTLHSANEIKIEPDYDRAFNLTFGLQDIINELSLFNKGLSEKIISGISQKQVLIQFQSILSRNIKPPELTLLITKTIPSPSAEEGSVRGNNFSLTKGDSRGLLFPLNKGGQGVVVPYSSAEEGRARGETVIFHNQGTLYLGETLRFRIDRPDPDYKGYLFHLDNEGGLYFLSRFNTEDTVKANIDESDKPGFNSYIILTSRDNDFNNLRPKEKIEKNVLLDKIGRTFPGVKYAYFSFRIEKQ